MSHNRFGKIFSVTTFGESHGPAIGCVIDGVPPGIALTEDDFVRDLERRADELGIPRSNVHGIFLTLDGSPPASRHFVAVGWHRIVNVLERFAEHAQPPEVKLFAAHYAKVIRMLALTEPETEQGIHEDPSV